MNRILLSLMITLMATSVLNAGAGAGVDERRAVHTPTETDEQREENEAASKKLAASLASVGPVGPLRGNIRVVPAPQLSKLPETALGRIASYLDPKSALALSATNKSLRGPINNKIMANDFIGKMVSGKTPNPRVITQLSKLAPKDRQDLLRTALIEKFGKDSVITIRNTSVFPEDIAAVCQRVYVGADPIIQQHNKDYCIGSLNNKEKESFNRINERRYRALTHVIGNPADHRVPTYLTATQEDLGGNLAAANTYFAAHPEVTLVLQAAAGNPTFTLRSEDLPASVSKLSLVGDHITTIGNSFLSGCSGLTTIDLAPLGHVTTIGNSFLSRCSGLTTIDLAPLGHVTSIGNSFLRNCRGLTSIDLSALSQVTAIGNEFVCDCRGLTSIDLSALSQVTHIGDYFLFNCSGLTSIDLSPLSQVTAIGNAFLYNCNGLTTIDLSPLNHLTTIGDSFLSGYRLTSIDLSPLSHVTTIGAGFLFNCSGLTSIDLSPLSHVSAIGEGFLNACSGLTTIDLAPLSNVRSIGNNFLVWCSGLTTIDLSPLSHVTAIGNDFLGGCEGLTTIDLSPLSHVTSIGDNFLYSCRGLTPAARAAVAAFVAAHRR